MSRTTAFAATAISVLLIAGPALAWGKKPVAPAATEQAAPGKSVNPTATPAPDPAPAKATPEQRAQADRLDPLARAAFWSNQFQLDGRDVQAGLHLSMAMRALGQNAGAVQAAQQVLVVDPDNRDAMLEEARAFVAQGQGFYAVAPLTRAKALSAADWRIWSLLGVAYGQVTRDADAAEAFRQALALSPNNPAVLSNQAMLQAARGDMAGAEGLLRQAAADPRSTVQERQNLALVLGLQGKFAEAEQLVRRDLPPELAENNIAYWKAAAGGAPDTRSWSALKGIQAAGPGGT